MSVLGTEGVVPIFATLAASGVETGTGVARAVSLSQNWVVTHTRRGVLTVEQQRGTAEPSSFSPAAEAPLLCQLPRRKAVRDRLALQGGTGVFP